MGDGSPTWSTNEGKQAPAAPSSSLFARVFSVIWALAPLFTTGLATPACFTYAAVKLRSRTLRWWAAVYWVVLIAALSLVQPWGYVPEASWRSQVQNGLTLLLMLAGTIQAFMIRRRLLAGRGVTPEKGAEVSGTRIVDDRMQWPKVQPRERGSRDQ
jgi:hypothetical protein